jgi:hypothetical protein
MAHPYKKFKRMMYWIGGLIVLVFVIPNTTNFKERRAFSDEVRLDKALRMYSVESLNDSVTVAAGEYYKRSKFSALFLGEKQRRIWVAPVPAKVFDYKESKGGLKPVEFGGGQQTISIKLKDKDERTWALRSVNKDQQSVLPRFLQFTFLRFLARDQLASANPYGQLALPVLAEKIGLHHTTPELVFVPYDKSQGKFNERMAGRLSYLEESVSSSWKKRQRFGSPQDIVNTAEMLQLHAKEKIPIDTLLYLKTRLFDMLVSDWDRHEGNWEWALTKENGNKVFEPIPKDRDNAFYQFDEGLVSHIILLFSPKFQSFRKEYQNVAGLMQQSKSLDRQILSTVSRKQFESTAEEIRVALTDEIIIQAFHRYPREVYKLAGHEHTEILKARLEKLPRVATRFYELTHE